MPDWLQEFRHGLVDEVFQNTEALPIRLVNYLQSREQKWYRVSIASSLTSRRTEIATSAWQPRLQGLLAEDATGTVLPRAEKDRPGANSTAAQFKTCFFSTSPLFLAVAGVLCVDYGFCYPVNRPCLDCRLLTFRLEGPLFVRTLQ